MRVFFVRDSLPVNFLLMASARSDGVAGETCDAEQAERGRRYRGATFVIAV